MPAPVRQRMTRKTIRLLSVGRPRIPHWKAASAHYLDRLRHWLDVREAFVADADAGLPSSVRSADESTRLLAALTPSDIVVCLDERGATYTSRQFATLLARLTEDTNRIPCFVVGGAYGLDDAIRTRSRYLLALGPMTLPHEMARVILLEQVYRAETILHNVPYHHA